jgi:hypothetical protein
MSEFACRLLQFTEKLQAIGHYVADPAVGRAQQFVRRNLIRELPKPSFYAPAPGAPELSADVNDVYAGVDRTHKVLIGRPRTSMQYQR